MGDLILTAVRDKTFEIVLNRPEKRNAITWEMFQAIDRAVEQANRMPDLRALLIRGEGKSFSAGIDLAGLMQTASEYGEGWQQRMRSITADFQAVPNHLERLEIPTIALLHGHCLGMALELALSCDLRIAADGTLLGLPETLRGLVPDVGGTTRLTRLVGPGWAKELIFTGRSIDAIQAERIGLINRIVNATQLLSSGQALAAEIAQAAPLAVGMAKRVIDGLFDLDRGLALEGWAQSQLISSQDVMEGIQAFMERRPPRFQGK